MIDARATLHTMAGSSELIKLRLESIDDCPLPEWEQIVAECAATDSGAQVFGSTLPELLALHTHAFAAGREPRPKMASAQLLFALRACGREDLWASFVSDVREAAKDPRMRGQPVRVLLRTVPLDLGAKLEDKKGGYVPKTTKEEVSTPKHGSSAPASTDERASAAPAMPSPPPPPTAAVENDEEAISISSDSEADGGRATSSRMATPARARPAQSATPSASEVPTPKARIRKRRNLPLSPSPSPSPSLSDGPDRPGAERAESSELSEHSLPSESDEGSDYESGQKPTKNGNSGSESASQSSDASWRDSADRPRPAKRSAPPPAKRRKESSAERGTEEPETSASKSPPRRQTKKAGPGSADGDGSTVFLTVATKNRYPRGNCQTDRPIRQVLRQHLLRAYCDVVSQRSQRLPPSTMSTRTTRNPTSTASGNGFSVQLASPSCGVRDRERASCCSGSGTGGGRRIYLRFRSSDAIVDLVVMWR
ncbi:hypothetical protein DFJ74DRAFT_680821 [Hyaloraphidium curvatum]|nr:hypothetical protein DFJ74DRAFT_680821 [Hyaloraphidium curvatum]